MLDKNSDSVTDKLFHDMTYTTLNNSYLNNPQLLNPNTSNISHTNNLKDKEKEIFSKLELLFQEYLLSEVQSLAVFKYIKEKMQKLENQVGKIMKDNQNLSAKVNKLETIIENLTNSNSVNKKHVNKSTYLDKN